MHGIGVIHWFNDRSTTSLTCITNQTWWFNGYVYWIIIGTSTNSTSFTCGWKLDQLEGLMWTPTLVIRLYIYVVVFLWVNDHKLVNFQQISVKQFELREKGI
jgi:hypothetical protein